MTDSRPSVVPYARFLEARVRRRLRTAELFERDLRATIDVDPASVSIATAMPQIEKGNSLLNTRVELPGVHMAGSNAHYDAHLEVGQHGFGLFLSPDAESPVLDVNGTPEQLAAVVDALRAALVVSRAAGVSQSAATDRRLVAEAAMAIDEGPTTNSSGGVS